MQEVIQRAVRATAAASSAAALMVLMASPASAAPGDANSSAFGISANLLSGTVTVAPTPTSTYPAGVDHTTASLTVPLLGSTGVLSAVTDGDTNGNSSATGRVADVRLLAVAGVPAITADVISATCTANGTTAAGSATLTNASIGTTSLDASPAKNTNVTVPGLITVTLNEQTTAGGVLTVNAIHVQIGPNGSLGDIIIGHAVCGPNTPVLGSPILTSTFYVGFGALAVLALGAYLVRRRTSAQQA